jgi:hypothetical protein
LEATTNVKPLQVAVGQNHTLLLLPSPLLLLPETKKGGSSEGMLSVFTLPSCIDSRGCLRKQMSTKRSWSSHAWTRESAKW